MTYPPNPSDLKPAPDRLPAHSQRQYLRLKDIVLPEGMLPISASTWWQGVKEGRYPQSIKLSPRVTAWRREDIEACIQRLQQKD